MKATSLILGAALLSVAAATDAGAQQGGGILENCLKAALAKHDGKIVKIEVERAESSDEAKAPAKGTPLLEIETRNANKKEWEMTCDEKTGTIVEVEQEVADVKDPAFSAKAKVTEDQAKKTATDAHGGEVTEVEYEIEANGAATYEIDVKPKSGEGEIKMEVDATSGKMVEHRKELYQIGEEASAEEKS